MCVRSPPLRRLRGRFPELEGELLGLVAGAPYQGPGGSPDRADAMVWALTDLMLGRGAKPQVRSLERRARRTVRRNRGLRLSRKRNITLDGHGRARYRAASQVLRARVTASRGDFGPAGGNCTK